MQARLLYITIKYIIIGMLVNEDDIEAYHRDGFVVLRGVVPDEVLASLERGVDTNMSSPSAWSNDYAGPCGGGVGAVDASDDQRGRRGRFFDDYVNWGRISEYRRAALSGPLPRIAADLMGTRRPRFYHEHVLVKEPGGTASQTPWHQDDPYYGVDSDVNVSLWVPLDPVPDVVALRILTGSHAHGRPRFVPHRFVDDVPYVSDDAPPPRLRAPCGSREPMVRSARRDLPRESGRRRRIPLPDAPCRAGDDLSGPPPRRTSEGR